MASNQRTWIVSLQARSAVRLADNKLLNVLSSPDSDLQVVVRVRNQITLTTDDPKGPTFFGALVAEAAGEFEDMDTAVKALTNIASPYFQVAALAANAAVDDPQDMLVSAPPTSPDDTGRFLVQRAAHVRSPAPAVRDLPGQAFMDMLATLNQHHREDRLHRAMAHYLLALSDIAPQNWILSAESLFVAVESLARVILQRLLREAGLPQTGEGKHQLALKQGFSPSNERDRSHLGKLDSWIREKHIFAEDTECYRNLLEASDAFEHSSEPFDYVRKRADASAREAFRLIRGRVPSGVEK